MAVDIVNKIMAYECGELSIEETVELFSELIRTKQAWSLQGSYGRTAAAFIRAGVITADTGTINQERLDEILENTE